MNKEKIDKAIEFIKSMKVRIENCDCSPFTPYGIENYNFIFDLLQRVKNRPTREEIKTIRNNMQYYGGFYDEPSEDLAEAIHELYEERLGVK